MPSWEEQWPEKSRWWPTKWSFQDVNTLKRHWCSGLSRCHRSSADNKKLICVFMMSLINMRTFKRIFCWFTLEGGIIFAQCGVLFRCTSQINILKTSCSDSSASVQSRLSKSSLGWKYFLLFGTNFKKLSHHCRLRRCLDFYTDMKGGKKNSWLRICKSAKISNELRATPSPSSNSRGGEMVTFKVNTRAVIGVPLTEALGP